MGHFRKFLKMYTKWGIFENVHKMGHFRKCTQNGEFSKMYTKCYAHNCLIFSCKCHIFCFFIGIKFNIDKVAPTRNNLKTPKISRRFAPEMYTIWRKPHYQENLPKYTYFGVFGVKKLKIKFSIKKKNNTTGAKNFRENTVAEPSFPDEKKRLSLKRVLIEI